MKVLVLTTMAPWLLDSGGKIATYQLVEILSNYVGKTKVMYIDDGKSDSDIDTVGELCDLNVVSDALSGYLLSCLKGLFSNVPCNVIRYKSRRLSDALMEELLSVKYDLVVLDHLHMFIYFDLIKSVYSGPIVIRAHNVEYEIIHYYYRKEVNFLLKPLIYWQYHKMKAYEISAINKCNYCFFISENDRKKVLSGVTPDDVGVLPVALLDNGYPKIFFDENIINTKVVSDSDKHILFLGSFDWYPNVEGLLWFYEKIFVRLSRQYSNIYLNVVGKNPTDEIKNIERYNINVTGYVDDVDIYYEKSHIFIVPLFSGSGIRIKILQAMYVGIPIVSTSKGCEGIDVNDGRDIMIADTEYDFYAKIEHLISDDMIYKSISSNSRKSVKEKYSSERIGSALKKMLRFI